MCIGKNEVEADEHEPEARLPEALVEHVARDLRVPMVDSGEDRKDRAAEEHVVEVGDDEVRVRHLLVERNRGEHHAGETSDHERDEETEHVQERRADHRPPLQHRREPRKHLDPARNCDDRASCGEERE